MEYQKISQQITDLEKQLYALKKMMADSIGTTGELPDRMDILRCDIADGTYGIDLQYIEEVILMCRLTHVPESHPWDLGILDFHGVQIPVMDAASRMRNERRDTANSDLIVICKGLEEQLFGIAVQKVMDVHSIESSNVERVHGATAHAPYIIGSHNGQGGHFLLLDTIQFFRLSGLAQWSK